MFRRAKNRQEASALSLSLSFVLSARVRRVRVIKVFFFVVFYARKKRKREISSLCVKRARTDNDER